MGKIKVTKDILFICKIGTYRVCRENYYNFCNVNSTTVVIIFSAHPVNSFYLAFNKRDGWITIHNDGSKKNYSRNLSSWDVSSKCGNYWSQFAWVLIDS